MIMTADADLSYGIGLDRRFARLDGRAPMRGQRVLAVAACCAGLALAAGPAMPGGQAVASLASGAAVGAAWGDAEEVPGLASLNAGDAQVRSVSCPSAGNCVAGGFYTDDSRHGEGFVLSQRGGQWQTAAKVPGLDALSGGGGSVVAAVSCPSAGNCVAGGSYSDLASRTHGFVVTERSGVWGNARRVRGLDALNTGGFAEVLSVSCPSAGNCGAVGFYKDGSGHRQAFVISEQADLWRKAREVPGTRSLNTGGYAEISSVSCPTAQTCGAGGVYFDKSSGFLAFVVSRRLGAWGTAREVPGLGALNSPADAQTLSVSCPSAGYCGAGGYYRLGAFVVSGKNGIWGKLRALTGDALIASMSCASAGNRLHRTDVGR